MTEGDTRELGDRQITERLVLHVKNSKYLKGLNVGTMVT